MNLHQLDERLHAALESLPAPLRPGLLRILDLPDEERAEAIGAMYREGVTPTLAEVLIDLEDEPALRGLVAAELRRIELGSDQ